LRKKHQGIYEKTEFIVAVRPSRACIC